MAAKKQHHDLPPSSDRKEYEAAFRAKRKKLGLKYPSQLKKKKQKTKTEQVEAKYYDWLQQWGAI